MKVLMARLLMAILFLPSSLCAPAALAQRALPDDNLAYPVLVRIPPSTSFGGEEASGFFINTSASSYFVTAKHVVFGQNGHLLGPTMLLLSYQNDPKESGANQLSLDLAALSVAGEIKSHPTADVVVVRIATLTPVPSDTAGKAVFTPINGVTILSATPNGIVSLALINVKKYDEVLVGNDVLLFGYPTSLGIQGSPQLDPLRPLLRKGIVAGLKADSKSIIVDCPSYFGNSGGPVVEIDRSLTQANFKVIGIVSQYVPFDQNLINHTPIPSLSNSGYSIITPMDYVLDMIN
jgi:hypothetical protein